MPNVPVGHFTEATLVWVGCVLAFVLAVVLRRAWIQRAAALKRQARRPPLAADTAEEGQ